MTPQDEYELGVSGGWGTPGDHLTGPIPRLRPATDSAAPTRLSADPMADTAAEDPAGSPNPDPIARLVPPDPVIQTVVTQPDSAPGDTDTSRGDSPTDG
ncbi:MAG TPA: hypothetical protein VES01_03265 [Dermatophilaceae bacterium]|nr:hypothetical protein [Dermatophilaceae bacterium]